MITLSNAYPYYQKVYFINLILIAALLPFTEYFSIQFTSITIILLLLSWLFLYSKEGLRKIRHQRIIFLFLAVYLVYTISLLRGGNIEAVEKNLVKKLALFIFPWVIGLSPKISPNQLKWIITIFISSLSIATVFTYFRGVSDFVITPEALTDLSSKIIIHRPYFGLFCAFSILALFFLFKKEGNIVYKALILLTIGYLLFFIIFIYAKMALIALVISAIVLILLILVYKRYHTHLSLILIFLVLGFITLYKFNPSVNNATRSALTYTNNIIQGKGFSYEKYNILIVGSINVRYINWGCAFTILKENKNWIYGLGIGNAQSSLQACYKDRNPWVFDNKMNAHNQFIEETLYNGIFGFLLFLSSLVVPAVIAFRKNNFLFISFILIFIFCSLTESVLNRQIGIFFYGFFNSLLFFNPVTPVKPDAKPFDPNYE